MGMEYCGIPHEQVQLIEVRNAHVGVCRELFGEILCEIYSETMARSLQYHHFLRPETRQRLLLSRTDHAPRQLDRSSRRCPLG